MELKEVGMVVRKIDGATRAGSELLLVSDHGKRYADCMNRAHRATAQVLDFTAAARQCRLTA